MADNRKQRVLFILLRFFPLGRVCVAIHIIQEHRCLRKTWATHSVDIIVQYVCASEWETNELVHVNDTLCVRHVNGR